MSNKLDGFINGVLNPGGQMRDFQHAARTFNDDTFRLAPKHKHLFHVAFRVNQVALKTPSLVLQNQNEINLLVKSVTLPSFNVQVDTVNQYNRIKQVQTKQTFNPVTIKFHDDNYSTIHRLWQNYYSYYYATPNTSSVPGSYNRTAMKNEVANRFRYGLDNNSSVPFFNSIVIYQMARQEFVSYTLVNPLVKSWNFDTANYGDGGGAECTMQLEYEGIYFGNGRVQPGNPIGFALSHYDRTPSPLTVGGGGTSTLFGRGGVLQGIADVFGDVASGRWKESPIDFLATAITAANTYNNAKKLTKEGIRNEGRAIINSTVTATFNNAANELVQKRTGGLNSIVVPTANTTTPTTVATQRNIP